MLTRISTNTYNLDADAVKLHIRVDGNDQDEYIDMLVAAAVEMAERYTGRSLRVSNYRLKQAGLESEIRLPYPPVATVSKFAYVDADGVERDIADYRKGDSHIYPETYDYNVGSWSDAVTVEYTTGAYSGYDVLDMAVLQLVAHLWEHRGDEGALEMPSEVSAMLDPHRVEISPSPQRVFISGTGIGEQSGTAPRVFLQTVSTDDSLTGDGTESSPLSVVAVGGLSTVATDDTITGTGATDSPLSVANPFTDADETKLDGIQAGAEVNVGETFTSTLKTKLDSIEDNATADQTADEIKTAYESNSNTNAFTDTQQNKLAGIAEGAEVNVNTDWNANSGDAELLNKPTIPLLPSAPDTQEDAKQYVLETPATPGDPISGPGSWVEASSGETVAGTPPRLITPVGNNYTLTDAENEIHVQTTDSGATTRFTTKRVLRAELTSATRQFFIDSRNPDGSAGDANNRLHGFAASISGNVVTLDASTYQGSITAVYGIVSGARGEKGDPVDLPDAPDNQSEEKKYELNVPATTGDATWTEAASGGGSPNILASVISSAEISSGRRDTQVSFTPRAIGSQIYVSAIGGQYFAGGTGQTVTAVLSLTTSPFTSSQCEFSGNGAMSLAILVPAITSTATQTYRIRLASSGGARVRSGANDPMIMRIEEIPA